MTYEQFAGRVGERFDVVAEGDAPALPMVLEAATEGTEPGGPGPQGQERLQFSLVFRGPAAPVLPQGTFQVNHEGMGELELFLVPIGRDDTGLRYEAAFA